MIQTSMHSFIASKIVTWISINGSYKPKAIKKLFVLDITLSCNMPYNLPYEELPLELLQWKHTTSRKAIPDIPQHTLSPLLLYKISIMAAGLISEKGLFFIMEAWIGIREWKMITNYSMRIPKTETSLTSS